MKKALGLISALVMIFSVQTAAFAAPPAVNSETYVVMEAKSGTVLASKGAHTKKYPASITKILTCAIALEQGDPADKHTMTYKATHSIEPGSTHIALTEEEVVTVNDLLQATMIESANDAANGLAEYISGDIDNFPELMNETLEQIGAENTHFVNSHGLHDAEHYTTAYDMALITRWALDIEGFRELFGAEDYVVPPTNKQPVARNIGTHNMMLVTSKYYYEGTTGGKLGWTPEARHTMVTLCEKNGMELICAVMDSRTQYEKFQDSIALYDYCFENFAVSELDVSRYVRSPVEVLNDAGEKVGSVFIPGQSVSIVHPPTMAKADISVITNLPESFHEDDEIAPMISFFGDDGELLYETELRWDYAKHEPIVIPAASADKSGGDAEGFDWRWLLCIPVFLAVGFIVLLLIRRRNLRLREQRRLEKRRRLDAMMEQQMRQSAIMTTPDEQPVMRVILPNSPNIRQSRPSSQARVRSSRPRGREGYRK